MEIEVPVINVVSALRAKLSLLEGEQLSLLRSEINAEYERRNPKPVPTDEWEDAFIKGGQNFQAIKHYRMRTSFSLRRCKDAIDARRETFYCDGSMQRPEPANW